MVSVLCFIFLSDAQPRCSITDPPSPTAQRQLILVGKVLQNLSNNTLPGQKEDYMQKLNEFITNNQADLLDFYNEILVKTDFQIAVLLTHSCFPLQVSSNLQPAARAIPEQVKQNALADIYNILLTCKGAIYQELGKHYNQGDGIYSELDAILSAGTIPSEQQ